MNAKEIFEKLVSTASSWHALSSFRRKPGKPGELVEKLSPEEREELQNLTSKDVEKEPARHVLNYMIGQYPESTVTVHTHTIKEEDDDRKDDV